jgi:hypothetical protein
VPYLSLPQGGRRYLYGKVRADVQRKLASARQTRDKGLPFAPERQTVGEFLTEWLEGQRQRLRPNTWKRYEEYIRIHTIPTLGRVKLAALSPQHLDRLLPADCVGTVPHHGASHPCSAPQGAGTGSALEPRPTERR